VIERFWIINGGVVDMPLGSVERLAQREDVVSVEPRFSGEEPPQDEVDDGRTRVATDPYFNLGQTGGWIGLLDTGVRFSHTQFTNPSHIDFRRDRIKGGADCNTGTNLNPNDDCWNHGTPGAGIITVNANQGVRIHATTFQPALKACTSPCSRRPPPSQNDRRLPAAAVVRGTVRA
jgi:hypothetical protein